MPPDKKLTSYDLARRMHAGRAAIELARIDDDIVEPCELSDVATARMYGVELDEGSYACLNIAVE